MCTQKSTIVHNAHGVWISMTFLVELSWWEFS